MHVLQTAKATKEQIQPEVEALIALKTEYKTLTGQDFGAPAAATKPAEEKVAGKQKQAPTAENAAKKAAKKEARRSGGDEAESQPAAPGATATAPVAAPATAKSPAAAAQPASSTPKGLHYYPSADALANTKCWLVALAAGVVMTVGESASAPLVPRWPAVVDPTGTTIFGANAVCLYLALHGAGKGTPAALLPAQGESTSTVEQVLDVEEFQLAPAVHSKVRTHA